VLPTEDDPEREQHGVEDALPDVPEKQHPAPVEANREPLHWYVDEGHGDAQSEDDPEEQHSVKTLMLTINSSRGGKKDRTFLGEFVAS